MGTNQINFDIQHSVALKFSPSATLKIVLGSIVACIMAWNSVSAQERKIDFQNDLIPVFTKAGCNAGACHGSAIGRGGFKLSLFGGDAKSDFTAIVREMGGRRINLAKPDESLIILKPTEYVEHGGGSIFDDDSESAELILRWIKQGAKNESSRSLKRVEVTPKTQIATSLDELFHLEAVAHYADGSKRDVTDWTVFTSSDSSSVRIDASAKTARVLRRGRHIIMARYLSEVLPIEVLMPFRDFAQKPTSRNDPDRNSIDDAIQKTLATLKLPASPQVDDGTFLRRVTLDLTGRLPTANRVESFAADSRSGKRERLIDELLQSEEFTQYWTLQFARWLRIGAKGDEGAKLMAEEVYHHWLADQIRNHVSYKEIANKLITATGNSNQKREANFYRTTRGPREQAEFFSELFMGSRVRCANCHNHPLDRWTQDDYHGLAAIFAKVEMAPVVKERPGGKVIHPRTLEEAVQRIPGKGYLPSDSADGRKELANWLTDESNPYFAKAAVNRLWQRVMGRGLVEPVDDFRSTNPATHPALLEQLAEDFIANGFNLRHTLRTIANSNAYARSANATLENKNDDRFYSHALRRPLEPEVLADAISDVLGVASKYGDQPIGTRAVAVIDPVAESRTLDVLGRCGRSESCESSSSAVGGLPQKLHLFNGSLLNARISTDESRLRKLLASGKSPTEIVREFYLLALGRTPSLEEEKLWQKMLDQARSKTAHVEFLEDFVWGLLVSEEFTTNH